MNILGIDPEVWKVLGVILASLLGGGVVSYFTLPVMLQKARAEIQKTNTETAANALEIANDATRLATEANQKYNNLADLLQGDLMINGQFSMEEIVKNGSAQFRGTVTRLTRVNTPVD